MLKLGMDEVGDLHTYIGVDATLAPTNSTQLRNPTDAKTYLGMHVRPL